MDAHFTPTHTLKQLRMKTTPRTTSVSKSIMIMLCALRPASEAEDEFQDAIKQSVQREKQDAKTPPKKKGR